LLISEKVYKKRLYYMSLPDLEAVLQLAHRADCHSELDSESRSFG